MISPLRKQDTIFSFFTIYSIIDITIRECKNASTCASRRTRDFRIYTRTDVANLLIETNLFGKGLSSPFHLPVYVQYFFLLPDTSKLSLGAHSISYRFFLYLFLPLSQPFPHFADFYIRAHARVLTSYYSGIPSRKRGCELASHR